MAGQEGGWRREAQPAERGRGDMAGGSGGTERGRGRSGKRTKKKKRQFDLKMKSRGKKNKSAMKELADDAFVTLHE